MKVLRPVSKDNPQTQGYSSSHKGYDHDDKPDPNYYSSFYGKVTQAKNSETKNWINKGTLTTADYGNYIKIKGEVDGKVVRAIDLNGNGTCGGFEFMNLTEFQMDQFNDALVHKN